MKNIAVVLGLGLLIFSCKGPLSTPEKGESKSGVHKAVVTQVIQAGEYTYLGVKEKKKEIWLAVPAMLAEKGDKLSYEEGLEMTDFHSKELDRTFDKVLFLQGVNLESEKGGEAMASPHMGEVKKEQISVSLEPTEGCISIAKLFEAKTGYAGQIVRIRGKVAKYNPEIMGKNWIHIQDGSNFNGNFDLTVTTDRATAVGDTIVVEGKIVLNKDFGYGYFYDVLMEDGKFLR